ncbi:hypothetical protein BAUCODRAFT_52567, partial [Baudoinia panamericana UAMH 10762]
LFSGHASQPAVYTVTICFSILSCVVVGLRLTTRLAIVRQTGWDDVLISLACVRMFLTRWTCCLCSQVLAKHGMGLHLHSLTPELIVTTTKWLWTFFWLYYASLSFTKLSLLLQYLRIFPHPRFVRACHTLLVIVAVWSVWAVFSGIFNCAPMSLFWTSSVWNPPGCIPRLPLWYSNSAINIVTDFATALLPIPIIHTLAIPKRQKNMLLCVFAAGLFTCLVSILRLIYIYPLAVSPDVTWDAPLVTIWSCVEANTAILCACVPTLKGLVQRYYPKLLDSVRSTP